MKMNVIITGAGGNLGKAAVEKFLSLDYNIIATVSPGKKLGYETNGPVDVHELDLTNESDVQRFAGRVIQAYGSIDAALLLVGGYAPGDLTKTNQELLLKMYTLNFETAYLLARPIFDRMLQQPNGGRLIFIGSRPSLVARQAINNLAYALSKSLIFNLASILNVEGVPSNVVATVVVPSIVDTPQNRESMPDANFKDWVKPEAIAETFAFLCSEEGSSLREPILKVYGNS